MDLRALKISGAFKKWAPEDIYVSKNFMGHTFEYITLAQSDWDYC